GATIWGVGGHDTWQSDEIPGDASIDIDWYVERARQAEAARFDFVFVPDSQFVSPDSPPHYLNRLEPLTLLSALAVATTNIGLIGTLSSSYDAPFSLARRVGSLDLISKGRAGWNVVTSVDAGTAANFGLEEHYDYATRYARAQEHVEVVRGLWDSYEDDAFPRDKASGVFFDRSKQHRLDHRGTHFSVAGPLNLSRSRQGQPVVFQAGVSEEGRTLGATVADGIFANPSTLDEAKAFYRDIKSRAAALGRDPRHVVICPALGFQLGATDEEAERLYADRVAARDFDKMLRTFSRPYAWHDFTQYDLDAPFPDVVAYAEKGGRTIAEHLAQVARERALSLRETVLYNESIMQLVFVGSPSTVADRMEQWLVEEAADGFITAITVPSDFARFVDEVLPILRERGVVRSEYDAETLRGNLGLPVPVNVHTAARVAGPVAA
ncbi:MAG: NtaA/DmoA family FMN-dependent monooxygenase, partial [Actinomycetota bacterium]